MAREKDAPLNNLQSLTDMPPDNTDIWMPTCVSMAVWRRTAGVKSTCQNAGLSECLLWVNVWVGTSEGVQERADGGSMFLFGWTYKKKPQQYQTVHSAEIWNLFLLTSLISGPAEREREAGSCLLALSVSNSAEQPTSSPPDSRLRTVPAGSCFYSFSGTGILWLCLSLLPGIPLY